MRISIARPEIGDEEVSEVSRVLRSGMIASGPETRLFEEEFARFVGTRYACAVNNGTSALSLSLSALGIGPGDEVITTPLTFVATANSILSCGAKPVFADIEGDTFNLSPKSVREAITEKTSAIMPVHLYGMPADMGEFHKISEEYGIKLIGDAAQAHGASVEGRMVGSLADVECFSFYPTKNMTTGEGGMVTTNDEEVFAKLDSIRNHGRPNSNLGVYEHERFGLNLRLTDIGSAIGRVQLRKLESYNEIRTRNAEVYSRYLDGVEGVKTPQVPKGVIHSWHQYTIRVEERGDLANKLSEQGIGTGVYYPRLIYDYPHLQSSKGHCPVAEEIVQQVISLPVHPGLEEVEVEEVASSVIDWIMGKSK